VIDDQKLAGGKIEIWCLTRDRFEPDVSEFRFTRRHLSAYLADPHFHGW